jgi:hypothetical protein
VRTVSGVRTAPALAVLLVVTLAGCASFGVKTTGAASVEDLAAENAYIVVYMDHLTKIATDLKVFQPSGSNPGPCNKGGNANDCYNADAQAIADLNAMLDALKTAKVPPRFVEADRLLRDALTKNVQGLELRNQALANNDDAAWAQHGPLLEQAQVAWTAAYAAFPADNRPALAP